MGVALSEDTRAEGIDAYGALVGFVERRVGDRASAEDLVQDAWVKALENGETITSAPAWMYRVLRNAIVDRHRRSGAARRALAELERELDVWMASEGEPVVCRCVGHLAQALPTSQAHALQRIEVDGVPVKTFAQEEGLTATNAGVRIFRARKALATQLRATCGSCADRGCSDCGCPPRV